jgi:predicted RNA-binding protein YlxR (DUF448 family)
MSSEPIRSCAGCGTRRPQSELLRFAAVEGVLMPGRELPGRGAYTCRRLQCFERACARRAFNRVLKRTVQVSPDLQRLYTDQR